MYKETVPAEAGVSFRRHRYKKTKALVPVTFCKCATASRLI
jgi:hypothetical protein